MAKQKQCSVCLTKVQSNVVFKWMRHADGQVFHVCAECAESGKVNQYSVHDVNKGGYTTVAKRGVC